MWDSFSILVLYIIRVNYINGTWFFTYAHKWYLIFVLYRFWYSVTKINLGTKHVIFSLSKIFLEISIFFIPFLFFFYHSFLSMISRSHIPLGGVAWGRPTTPPAPKSRREIPSIGRRPHSLFTFAPCSISSSLRRAEKKEGFCFRILGLLHLLQINIKPNSLSPYTSILLI